MSDGKITTESVAQGAAETAPIVLRHSDNVRLVFHAMLVDKPEAPVRGVFVWQRKKKADEWENITGESLNKLKAGEARLRNAVRGRHSASTSYRTHAIHS